MKPLEEFYIEREYERISDKAYCSVCEWKGSGHNKARQHCKETKHLVILEANYNITYKSEPNKWLTDHEHKYYRSSRGEKSDVCIICGHNPKI
jgi:hypothetical protein